MSEHRNNMFETTSSLYLNYICGPNSNLYLLNNDWYNSLFWIIFITEMPPGQLRAGRVLQYVSSSSAKRRERKIENCHFCARYFNDCQSLKAHLEISPACYACYCRKYKCKSMNGVLIKLYSCISCSKTDNARLSLHLSRNQACLQHYLVVFEAKDLR